MFNINEKLHSRKEVISPDLVGWVSLPCILRGTETEEQRCLVESTA